MLNCKAFSIFQKKRIEQREKKLKFSIFLFFSHPLYLMLCYFTTILFILSTQPFIKVLKLINLFHSFFLLLPFLYIFLKTIKLENSLVLCPEMETPKHPIFMFEMCNCPTTTIATTSTTTNCTIHLNQVN